MSRPWALTRWPVVRGLERGHGATGGVLSPLAAWNRYLAPLPAQPPRRVLRLPSLPQVEMPSTAYLPHIDSHPTRPLLSIMKKRTISFLIALQIAPPAIPIRDDILLSVHRNVARSWTDPLNNRDNQRSRAQLLRVTPLFVSQRYYYSYYRDKLDVLLTSLRNIDKREKCILVLFV